MIYPSLPPVKTAHIVCRFFMPCKRHSDGEDGGERNRGAVAERDDAK